MAVTQSPRRTIAAKPPSEPPLPPRDELGGLLQRPLFGVLPIDVERGLYVLFVAVAALLRLWDLGPRMLHHDESLHALYSWYLYNGRGYVHDPMMHGPFLFELGALLYFLFGATDAVARLGTALFGVLLVGLVYLSRDFIGRGPALAATGLMAIAPSIIYYSRFQRHDIYLAVFQFLFLIGIFRYARSRSTRDLYLVAAALALAFATKEDTYLQIAYLAPFMVFLVRDELADIGRLVLSAVGIGKGPQKSFSAFADVSILIGTLSLPLVAGGAEFILLRTHTDVDTSNIILVGLFAVLAIAGSVVGLRWNPRVWITAAIIFWGIFIALYTTFFANPGGLYSGSIGGLKYWIDQQGVARGNQPWFYYLLLLPLYEFVAVLFGIGGAIYLLRPRRIFGIALAVWGAGALGLWLGRVDQIPGTGLVLAIYFALPVIAGLAGARYFFRPRSLFEGFLVYWTVGALALYGWASEKMPWMVIHMAIPLVLLAGVAVARLIEQVDAAPTEPASLRWRRYGVFALTLFLAGAALISGTIRLVNAGGPATLLQTVGGAARLAEMQGLFQAIGLLAASGILLYVAYSIASRLGRPLAMKVAALGVLVVLTALSVRTAWQVNFYNGDVPVEMLVYTQTSPDVGHVLEEIDRLAFRTGAGRDKIKVVYDSGVSWPFEWYLRDYKGRVFIGAGNVPSNALDAPIVLVGMENNRDQVVKQQLGNNYVAQRYRLRWWFPEDYRSMTLDSFRWFLTDPATRHRIWRYFMFRETLNPLGSTDFMVFVRRELAAGAWAAPQAAVPGADQDAYAKAEKTLTAVQTIGGTKGTADGQFADPRSVAVAPDGSLYVVDTFNHRVQKFDQDGRHVLSFGQNGNGDGEFKEPWGIAVAPNGDVYVADTWNHRVQRFDADGKFKQKWGAQQLVGNANDGTGNFFGPRDVAVDQAGSVLVTDAGNHRVQRFTADGQFQAVYGGRGAGEGLFSEPVGIAIDRSGNIYVADTWNRRIQKLDPNGRAVAQWAVAGWESESVANKPYLSVDAEGSIYFTDPEQHRAVKLSASGQVLAVWGKQGRDNASFNLPTGISVAPNGEVWVADTLNQRVVKFAPIR